MKTTDRQNRKVKASAPEKSEQQQRNAKALQILGAIIKEQKGKVICQTCGQKTRTKGDDGFCSECVEAKPELITATVNGRCYDDGFICSLEDALKQFGLSVTSHPSWDGSDEVGLIISNRKLTEAEIRNERTAIEGDEDLSPAGPVS